ncbi:MAG: 3-demethylubiquinone-9 3-methyltransferase, partial [uncultured Thermoleophilia bacterium]
APEDRPEPLVRHGGRGGRGLLRLRLRALADRERHALHRSRPPARRHGDERGVRAGRPALRRHQRRPAVHVLRGGLAGRHVRGPGRGRPLLGEAVRRRRGRAVRLAQGPLRPVLAGRAHRDGRAVRRPGPHPRAAGDAGDVRHEEARHRRAAGGSRRRPGGL